jgi:RNA polymerase sigma-70 factor, ECF subfamily
LTHACPELYNPSGGQLTDSGKTAILLDKRAAVAHLLIQMVGQNHFTERVRECTDRLAASGVDALGALFDLTSLRLVRFAVAVTRNQHDAEDAVQTALVRLAGRPQLLQPAACPWAYLLRMVRNEALVIARRKQRCRVTADLTDLVTLCRVDELEREESYRAVWSALRTLPPEQAEVVVLKIWEDMTFAQIGQILETSPNTVASRYQYAMARLTRRLASQQREVRRD